mgnify:CR=1 FL=1
MKTLGEVYNAVIEVLSEIQEFNGQPLPNLIGSTCPTVDLLGFDSFHCVEASVLLSGKLGYDIDVKILLPSSASLPPPTIDVIACRIMDEILDKEERKKHD